MDRGKTKSIFAKIFALYDLSNRFWVFIAFMGIALMLLYYSSPQKNEPVYFPCSQTPDSELTEIDHSELKTEFAISKIDTTTELMHFENGRNTYLAISKPKFSNFSEVNDCIEDEEQVLTVTVDGVSKIYPHKILAQHQLVNDIIQDQPILITYCGLCNSYQVFSRTYREQIYQFGHAGLLYKNSDLLFDVKTDSLWSIFSGEALVGNLTGARLSRVPFAVMTYAQAKEKFPDSEVLSFDTGFRVNYTIDSFADFGDIENQAMPSTNSDPSFKPKQLILGFNYEENYYATAIDDQFTLAEYHFDDLTFTISKTEGSYKLQVNGVLKEIIPILSYWYVWFDYYPDTIILQTETTGE